MADKKEAATYTHGHHASVLRSHSWRTALNSAAYILPHIKPHMKVLDIGCGPGTITVDLATYVPEGHVTGLDFAGEALTRARSLAEERGLTNIDFVGGDANSLEYANESFDIVLCHQVLQHVRDPVGILKEMKRVAKSGGIVAARESDYGAFVWYPEIEGLEDWRSLYFKVARNNGGEPNAGRHLHVWAKRAGFNDAKCSMTSWCYNEKPDVTWWSDTWAERTSAKSSNLAKTAVDANFAQAEDLEKLAQAWKTWGKHDDAWIAVPSAEIICVKP
ncbi:putative ubiE/COQ5 methyltransferase [Dactylonectria macrodidyma]|uniref:UbiE/COQ5 methyltransferase n=1 Tax=Dactylonectria macrodidyma TaxID=307937 RepID=A0A9P9E4U2_9HYPO|nr:putative ubiE/COQ5 methyltransferase [Dactylonectria macrodidyma]